MAKYSKEYKVKIVKAYLAGKGGTEKLSKQYHVARTLLQRWIKAYQKFGAEGLARVREKKKYTFEFKRSAVECYLSTEASYQDVALLFGMNNPTLLTRWTKQYLAGGMDALRPKPKGRPPAMPKQHKQRIQDTPQDKTAEHLHTLQEENLKLRIENAYLKELRRLRLQKEMQSRKQGSSAASGENFS